MDPWRNSAGESSPPATRRNAGQRSPGQPPAPPGLEGHAGAGWARTPAPATAFPWAQRPLDAAAGRGRPAGPQPVDLLAGPAALAARPDPLQPDVHQSGQGAATSARLLDRRRDPGHVQARRSPTRRTTRTRSRRRYSRPRSRRSPTASSCSTLLEKQRRHDRRQPGQQRARRSWPSCSSASARRCCSSCCSCCSCAARPRRPAARRADVLRPLARAARGGRRAASHVRRRGRHRRGQGGAHRDRRLPQEPRQVPALGGRIPRGVLLSGPPGHRQDAARPRGGGRGRACRSSRCRPRSSSR